MKSDIFAAIASDDLQKQRQMVYLTRTPMLIPGLRMESVYWGLGPQHASTKMYGRLINVSNIIIECRRLCPALNKAHFGLRDSTFSCSLHRLALFHECNRLVQYGL